MSKALFSDYYDVFVNTVKTRFGIKLTSPVQMIFDSWNDLDLHLIYEDNTSDEVVKNAINRRLDSIILPYYKFFDLNDVDLVVGLESSNSDTRTVTVKANNANEAQPINSSITDITSPTSKSAKVGEGMDTNTRTTVDDQIKYVDYLKEIKSFGYQIRKVLSPLIEELSVMY